MHTQDCSSNFRQTYTCTCVRVAIYRTVQQIADCELNSKQRWLHYLAYSAVLEDTKENEKVTAQQHPGMTHLLEGGAYDCRGNGTCKQLR